MNDDMNPYPLAYSISEEYLSPLPTRWAHVQGVARRAFSIADLFSVREAAILSSAAILHDIGYSPHIRITGFHPLDGARFLQLKGFDSRLCALVAQHSCAYREAGLRGLSADLSQWQDEDTPVRDALWWADMTTTPDGEPTNVISRLEEIQDRYGRNDIVTIFIQQATPELVAAVERTEERLRAAGLGHLAK